MEKAAPASSERSGGLTRLLRLHVPVVVQLAHKKMNVDAISKLAVGAIIEFDKSAEEQLELKIRDKTIGYGAAVKIGEKFGLRVASIVDVRETIQALGDNED
ncbi:MAG: FliM/FliN family flagellar motor switch protein [Planctomycetota bacterium]